MALDPRMCVSPTGDFILPRVLTYLVGLADSSYMQCLPWSREFPPNDRTARTAREAAVQLEHYASLALAAFPADLVVIRVHLRIANATIADVEPIARESLRVRIANAARAFELAADALNTELRAAVSLGDPATVYTRYDIIHRAATRVTVMPSKEDKDHTGIRVAFDGDRVRNLHNLHVTRGPAFPPQPEPATAAQRVEERPIGARPGLD